MCDNRLAAAELFGLLSAFWQPPDELFWHNLADGSVDEELANFSQLAGFSPALPEKALFQQTLPTLDALKLFYLRCFIGIGRQSTLPVESIYKKWTEDPSARLPIAGSTGYLMGDPALHARYLLDHYQLQVPPDYLNQHFDWLDSFGKAVEAIAADDSEDSKAKQFYQLALQTLIQAVQCQSEKYAHAN